jgi:electron transfer flavoprotein beta subunit
LKIICLVKQVPDTEAKIKVKSETKDIDREGLAMVLNPYDEFAVEAAIKLKEGGVAEEVTIVTVGEKKSEEAIRTALAMGADKAIRVEDAAISLTDSSSVAVALAAAAKSAGADLILCGKQASDDDASAVGPMVAQLMGIPCVNVVLKLEVADGKLTATREIEGGEETVECPLPAVITCTKGLNEPRYPSLPGIMKAKRKPLDVKAGGDIGMSGAEAKTEISALNPPPARAEGKKFEGDPADIVPQVIKALREEAKVI